MSQSWKPDIFGFLDFRTYLKAYYDAAKAHKGHFSYRYFARRAGYASPNFLQLVISGKRGLSADSIERFAKALDLAPDEQEFFSALVAFNQAQSAEEQNRAFMKVAASRRFRQARRIDHAMYRYLSHWYYPAIREMTARDDFQEDPAWIATQLLPSISTAEAAGALQLLLELGLVTRDAAGRVRRGEPTLTTGHEVRNLAAGNYHRQMLERASESIERVPRERRELGATTICVNPDTIAEIKLLIQDFREQILERCDRDDDPSVVYQFNVQFFPLSKSKPRLT
jgi:uncharacterized protein (TIGR02147 family)